MKKVFSGRKAMKRGAFLAALLGVFSLARAEETEVEEYVIDIASDSESRAITAADVAAATGKTLVKTGVGTLSLNDTMKDFTGDIRVRGGFLAVLTTNALGTADGETYVESGATLVNYATTAYTDGTHPAFGQEHIHLAGMGCGGWGAIQNKAQCVDFCRKVTLEADTRIVVTSGRFDFRSSSFNMNGHFLEHRDGDFFLVQPTISNMGSITNLSGYLEFQSWMKGLSSTATVTIKRGSSFGFWDGSSWVSGPFFFESNTTFRAGSGTFKFAGQDNRNIISGTVMLEGIVKNDLTKMKQCQFRGKITGPGGFRSGKGGYMQFLNGANDFTGGLALNGVVENGEPVGGVVLYANGAIPNGENAMPLILTNAVLYLRNTVDYDLPALEMAGRTVISNQYIGNNTVTVKSLRKTGAGELTVCGPLTVKGDAEIEAGTLRLAQFAAPLPGLKWTYQGKDQGIDLSGVSYAYKGWPAITNQEYSYTGYIRIPGEAGTPVTCNWMSSIARKCTVTIGGVLCAAFRDKTNQKDNIEYPYYDRLAMYKPVTLTAGWQPITVTMGNWWDLTRGPQANTSKGWEANFAIGVDWENRCVTNAANYAKLLDPGDGSFLRVKTATNVKEATVGEEALYRATFQGSVAFGPGTVLDLDDTAPYTPLTLPALAGVPEIRNGAVKVTSATWTLRAADIAAGQPLTVADSATLTFAGGTSVVVDGDPTEIAALRHISKGKAIFTAPGLGADAYTFTLSERLRAIGCSLAVKGDTLLFSCPRGLLFTIR